MSTGIAFVDAAVAEENEVFRFGPFTLCPVRRVLLEGASRSPLGSRAFEILLLLLERAGTFVSKDEIVARVWPTTVVIEGNLRVHMTALRKALSEGRDGRQYIVTVPNRGYSFVAPVTRGRAEVQAQPAEAPVATPGLLAPLHRIVGRDAARDALGRQLLGSRLVTVVGAGGMGKTTIATEVAISAEPAPWTAVRFVDLAPVSQGRMVPDAVAAALELRVDGNAHATILTFLADKSMLLVLDNCEHVLADAAELAEAILRAAPSVRLLATSREPLKADGERIHRLRPLELPDTSEPLTAAEAMRFGAIELFVDRANAALDTFIFQDADVEAVVDVCRRLDGIPLAIELAAASVGSLGVRGIRTALQGRFLQSMSGRRTASPRHRTLEAMIDWSYELLSPCQRSVLARLSLFSSTFTLESAAAIARDASSEPCEIFDAVMELAAKSLLSVDASDDPPYFRLLETTRSFASTRLLESGELPAMRRRHAEHTIELLRESEVAWRGAAVGAWRRRYGRHVDDVRAALAWAMSAEGDARLGIALTVRSVQLLCMMSRTDESMRFTSTAMRLAAAGTIEPALRFELHTAYALLLIHTRREMPGMQQTLERAGEIAREQGDRRLVKDAIGVNWLGAYIRSDTRAMRELVQQFESLTAGDGDPADRNLTDRCKAQTLHLCGDQRGARHHAEQALAPAHVARPPFLGGTLFDRAITMEALLARILWLQGLPDQAEMAAARALDLARQDGGSMTTTMVMGLAACPLAMWTGRLDLARERVSLFARLAREHSLGLWRVYAQAFEALLGWQDGGRQGDPVLPDRQQIRAASLQLGELLATLHADWADDNDFSRGESGDAGWAQAELLRVRAERALAAGHVAETEDLLQRSLVRVRQDGTLSWELRTTTSLARLRLQQGRPSEALEAMRAVLGQFTEGYDTADVREATALHDSLASAAPRQASSTGLRLPVDADRRGSNPLHF